MLLVNVGYDQSSHNNKALQTSQLMLGFNDFRSMLHAACIFHKAALQLTFHLNILKRKILSLLLKQEHEGNLNISS